VFPRLVAAEHREHSPVRFLFSGIEGLDALWGDGLETGSSTLFIGPAGVGKTSLSMAYATATARAGNPAHVFLFDESSSVTLRRATRLGMDADRLHADGILRIDQIDPAELSPGEFIEHIRNSVERDGTKLLVLDSLNGLLAAMPGEEYMVLHMHELLSYLGQIGVTTILVLSQTGILGASMGTPVDLSYLADNILLLRYFEAGGQVRKAVSVVKKRSGEHETSIREMAFSNSAISVGEVLTLFTGVLTGMPSYTGAEWALKEAPDGNREP
jgi:circadian clock protein KaiC